MLHTCVNKSMVSHIIMSHTIHTYPWRGVELVAPRRLPVFMQRHVASAFRRPVDSVVRQSGIGTRRALHHDVSVEMIG